MYFNVVETIPFVIIKDTFFNILRFIFRRKCLEFEIFELFIHINEILQQHRMH